MNTNTTTTDTAYNLGYKTGLLDPHAPATRYSQRNPYDSRTKLGKAWKRGFDQGFSDLCTNGRQWADAQ